MIPQLNGRFVSLKMSINTNSLNDLFTQEVLEELFPRDRADRFFSAMLGDPEEGAYDIHLEFKESLPDQLKFEFQLKQRPGKCLVCSVTYGLPQVFSRHPVIDLNGLVSEVDKIIDGRAKCSNWRLGSTMEVSGDLHVVPFTIFLERLPES